MKVKHIKVHLIIAVILFTVSGCKGSEGKNYNHNIEQTAEKSNEILPGAMQTGKYVSILQNKKVAVLGNHTSRINDTHLVDSLLNLNIEIVKIFSPEHGFRGQAAAGEHVKDGTDQKTGIPVISLYGSNRKPRQEQLQGIDIVVMDIQDVGLRFYTYISTMTYMMDVLADLQIPFLILDRPNPNGHIVDGPVLEKDYSSFVGLHQIPVFHGMTVAEYAKMVKGENWITNANDLELIVVEIANYNRNQYYPLPIAPSPNLPNMTSVMLYGSLCFFEGTVISVGRGTDFPFQVYGHPDLPTDTYEFTFHPTSRSSAPTPKLEGEKCYGMDLRDMNPVKMQQDKDYLNLSYLINCYNDYPDKDDFFNSFFEKLSGTSQLRDQIKAGLSKEQIRDSWQKDLTNFREIRSKYLIYQ